MGDWLAGRGGWSQTLMSGMARVRELRADAGLVEW